MSSMISPWSKMNRDGNKAEENVFDLLRSLQSISNERRCDISAGMTRRILCRGSEGERDEDRKNRMEKKTQDR